MPSQTRRPGEVPQFASVTRICQYESPFALDEQRPDFVILDPTAGITVISVVGGEVLGAVNGTLRVNVGHESDADDPLKKAIAFGDRINRAISNRPSLRLVRVRGVAVFPTLTRAEALARGVDTVVAPEQSLFKDDLSTTKTDAEFLLRFLLRVHEGGSGEDLTPDQINELRGLVHPDTVVGPPPEQGSLFTVTSPTPVIKVMDRQQERVARKLGGGHRLIRGVAGSGKTLILLHLAEGSRTEATQAVSSSAHRRGSGLHHRRVAVLHESFRLG